jgi:HAD superfamily hydrolase (TIGR01490 family)
MRVSAIAFFDFDGTISNRDSFLLFVRKTAGLVQFAGKMGLLAPRIARFILGLYSNHDLKEDVLCSFFKGWTETQLEEAARHFCRTDMADILRPAALTRLAWHKGQGHRVVVVSATPEIILAPWCEKAGFDLIATRMEVVGGRFTGRIEGENCREMVKIDRIREKYRLEKYDQIFAYGDTEGDLPMLSLADQAFYRPFRGKEA